MDVNAVIQGMWSKMGKEMTLQQNTLKEGTMKAEKNTQNTNEAEVMLYLHTATSPKLMWKDFRSSTGQLILPYNELRSVIRGLRDKGWVTTSKTGYKLTDEGYTAYGVDQAPLPAPKSPRKSKEKTKKVPRPSLPCLCGCSTDCRPGSYFLPGHDARVKGWVTKHNNGELDDEKVLEYAKSRNAIVVGRAADTLRLLSVSELKSH